MRVQPSVPGSPLLDKAIVSAVLTGAHPPEPVVDLSFAGHGRGDAIHAIHPFAARFPPPLARWAIERYSHPGERVLDPFAGSGTALVEARLTGRHALAAELDPLSRLIARVKATPIDPARMAAAECRLAAAWMDHGGPGHDQASCTVALPVFPRRDYWFHPRVCHDLAVLRNAIAREPDPAARAVLLVIYSSVIIAKGPSTVANALDIAHSRAHHIDRADPPDVWSRLQDRLRRARRGLRDFWERAGPDVDTHVLGHDARALPYRSRSVDMILTSPPYVTAIEYPRGHKFSVWWIGDLIGVHHRVYERLRGCYIGTENVHQAERARMRAAPAGLPLIDQVTGMLDDVDAVRAGRARRYFIDMCGALAEMLRVLRPGRHAVIVVGDSTLGGVAVPTAACLTAIAESLVVDDARFVLHASFQRTIRERSRQLPIKRGANAGGMQTEQVLVLQSCPARRSFGGATMP